MTSMSDSTPGPPPFALRPPLATLRLSVLLMVTAVGVTGCGPGDQITKYTVPKRDGLNPGDAPPAVVAADDDVDLDRDRMLAAIVPHGEKTWFFRVDGLNEPVKQISGAFLAFLATLDFDGPAKTPQWELPDGWRERPAGDDAGNPMFKRFATIEIDAEGTENDSPLELKVSNLASGDTDADEFALLNVNRWRRQLGLRPLEAGDLDQRSTKMEVAGSQARLIDYVGNLSIGGGGAPFMQQRQTGRNRPPPPRSPTVGDSFQTETPDGWKVGRVGGIRKAAFDVERDGMKAEVTVFQLVNSGVLPNFNRWRGEVGLESVTQAEFEQQSEKITIGGIEADYAAMKGPEKDGQQETTLAAMAADGDKAWFFKLRGDANLVADEEGRFKEYLKSVKFSSE